MCIAEIVAPLNAQIKDLQREVQRLESIKKKVEAVVQDWRDRTMGSPHMTPLKSNTLEECATEVEGALEG